MELMSYLLIFLGVDEDFDEPSGVFFGGRRRRKGGSTRHDLMKGTVIINGEKVKDFLEFFDGPDGDVSDGSKQSYGLKLFLVWSEE